MLSTDVPEGYVWATEARRSPTCGYLPSTRYHCEKFPKVNELSHLDHSRENHTSSRLFLWMVRCSSGATQRKHSDFRESMRMRKVNEKGCEKSILVEKVKQ